RGPGGPAADQSQPGAPDRGVAGIFGIALGAGAAGNQNALYSQASASQVGTAAGLFRTFSYIGSIASSAITGIVFRTSVTDHGLHTIAIILVALGAVVLVMTLVDRQLT